MRYASFLCLCLSAPAAALDLSLPIDCALGETCYIQQYVDHDTGPGVRDFACGALSYDGHKGTDFALPTRADLAKNVSVLAAAPGRVTGVRNTMPDEIYSDANAAEIAGRECGNGVVIRHDDGYETQYCHLKEGSVVVTMGDNVERGAILGTVGLSGRTEFPHMHLSVRKDGKVVDPFATGGLNTCQSGAPNLWATDIEYSPGGILDAGFSAAVPEYDIVKAGRAARSTLPAQASGLVLFGLAYGGEPGDKLRLVITGPDGKLFDQAAILARAQAQFFRAGGKRLTQPQWPAGNYVGEVQLIRDGEVLDTRTTNVTIE